MTSAAGRGSMHLRQRRDIRSSLHITFRLQEQAEPLVLAVTPCWSKAITSAENCSHNACIAAQHLHCIAEESTLQVPV